ncbi:hypothetical protein J3F82_006302, partial [Coemansia sp. RSA 637]
MDPKSKVDSNPKSDAFPARRGGARHFGILGSLFRSVRHSDRNCGKHSDQGKQLELHD